MQNYEIRLHRPQGAERYDGRLLGDFHAIRRAHTLAGESDDIEVWRGPHCIYRRKADEQSPPA